MEEKLQSTEATYGRSKYIFKVCVAVSWTVLQKVNSIENHL